MATQTRRFQAETTAAVLPRTELATALAQLAAVAGKSNVTPILGCVLVEIAAGIVTLTTNELDTALRLTLPTGADATPWAFTVNVKDLRQLVYIADGDAVGLTTEESGKRLVVSVGGYIVRLPILPAEEFPAVPALTEPAIAVLPYELLTRAIAHVRVAITAEDTRYFLNGAQLSVNADTKQIAIVATDGHRLHLSRFSAADVRATETLILHSKALRALMRLPATTNGVSVSVGQTHYQFESGRQTVLARKIDATFPAYEKVIPQHNDKRAVLRRVPLLAALQRVLLFSHPRSRSVTFEFTTDRLALSANDVERGRAEEPIAIKYDGPAVTMVLNGGYVSDVLTAIDAETLELTFKDELTQVQFSSLCAQGYEFAAVVMPMRI